MNTPGKTLLLLGALANFGLALLHVGIALMGPAAYLYFGAAGLAEQASRGSPLPAILTLLLAVIFVAWGLYALSGASILPRLPWPRAALLLISFVYLLRGAIVILDILRLILGVQYPLRQTVFSLGALVIGVILLVGVTLRWSYLSSVNKRQ